MSTCHPCANFFSRCPQTSKHLSIYHGTMPMLPKGSLTCLPLPDQSPTNQLRCHSIPIKAAFVQPHYPRTFHPRQAPIAGEKSLGTVLRVSSLHHHNTISTMAQAQFLIHLPIQFTTNDLRKRFTLLNPTLNMLRHQILLDPTKVLQQMLISLNR